MADVPDELKWYTLDPGQWLVIEAGVDTPPAHVRELAEALPADLRARVLIVLGKAWVLDPPDAADIDAA